MNPVPVWTGSHWPDGSTLSVSRNMFYASVVDQQEWLSHLILGLGKCSCCRPIVLPGKTMCQQWKPCWTETLFSILRRTSGFFSHLQCLGSRCDERRRGRAFSVSVATCPSITPRPPTMIIVLLRCHITSFDFVELYAPAAQDMVT